MIELCAKMDYLIKNGYDSRVKAISIGANRRRGRPSKTKGALEYQDSDQDIFLECQISNLNLNMLRLNRKVVRRKV